MSHFLADFGGIIVLEFVVIEKNNWTNYRQTV